MVVERSAPLLYHHAPPSSVVSRISAMLSTFLAGESHSVTEMARLTGLPTSTVHRLATELLAGQLLLRMPDGQFRIGPLVQQLSGDPMGEPLRWEQAPQVVMDLSDATRRRARLGVLVPSGSRQTRVAYIEKRARSQPATAFADGATLPAHATALGKALLAFAPREVVDAAARHLTAYTANTLDTPARLRRALRVVRLTRSATSCGEFTANDFAVAAPVFGRGGAVVAALELEVQNRHTDVEVARTAVAVAARGLSREFAIEPLRNGQVHLQRVLPAAGRRKVVS